MPLEEVRLALDETARGALSIVLATGAPPGHLERLGERARLG